MFNLIPDFKHAVRTLIKKPGFSLAVASALGLGIGLNVTVLALMDALLLRPFQFPDYERIAVMREAPRGSTEGEMVAPANFLDWRDAIQSMERVAAWESWDTSMAEDERAEPLVGARVTAGFFEVFGSPPARGRDFAREDEKPGNDRRIVISHGMWQRVFGSDPATIGRQMRLDGEFYTITGIAPKGFSFPSSTELWAPVAFSPERALDREHRNLNVAGKIGVGRTMTEARAEMQLLAQRLEQEHPATNRERGVLVQSMTEAYREQGTGALVGLLHTGAGLVLLVAGANIAGLLLARSLDRRHEFALRAALGASRAQIVRLLVIESVVLGLAASVLALLLASGAVDAMRASMPADMARYIEGWDNLRLSGLVIALMPLFAIGVGLLVGVVPALAASRTAPGEALKSGGRSLAGGRSRQRGRRALVVIEIALALALLVTSALIVAGGRRLVSQPGGFDSERLLAVDVRLPKHDYGEPESKRNLATRLLDVVAPLPAVESVALTSILPASGWNPTSAFVLENEPERELAQRPKAGYRIVSTGYFDTMRIPLRGRAFSDADREGSMPVAIISATMAKRFWPGQNPVGRRVRMERFGDAWLTIVGVAGDTRMFNWWDGEENLSALYVPVRQQPFGGVMQLAVRTRTEPTSGTNSVRSALTAVNPLFTLRARTMSEAIADSGLGLTYLASMMTVCSGVALLLAAVGIYSVMAYDISQRTHEFGVRMALGATSSRVMGGALRQAGVMTLAGILIGLVLSFALAQAIASAMFGLVSPDASTFVIASATLAAVSLVAAYLPARRATKVDPMTALRAE